SPPPPTAAQQLDDLLTHLGQMQSKVSPGHLCPETTSSVSLFPKAPPTARTGERGQSGLAGAPAVPKGNCASCHKLIVGKMITALGKTWHPEHFTCAQCGQEMGTSPFFEQKVLTAMDKTWHPEHFFCAHCGKVFGDKVLTAMDKTWHPEHFFCAHCGKVFGDDGFHEKNGKPYCQKDFLAMFSPRCKACERPVMENYLSALQGVWHPECFVCGDCCSSFTTGSFFELDGHPYCELHYHQRRGSVCHGCGKPIAGRCISAMGHRFHPEHFICAFCLGQLHKGTFREQGDKAYCHACHSKLFV
uniref:Leupaxin n=1 Tax=Pelodiscus sinensis TaxID=13735 RepID=K7FAX9_PELSI